MANSASPFFRPWQGWNYASGFVPTIPPKGELGSMVAKRTLILGESYYQTDNKNPLRPGFTVSIVEEHIRGIHHFRFYSSIVNAFLDLRGRPALNHRRVFWEAVAHYTFIQEPVGCKPRDRPTTAVWLNGHAPFQSVLGQLQPKLVIVLGYQLWDQLPPAPPGPLIAGPKRGQTRKYSTTAGQSALAFPIQHPSSGRFSPKYWHPYIIRALQLA